MLDLVIRLLRSFGLFYVLIISLVPRSLVCPRFVMSVNWLKVMSYFIILLLIVLLCHLKLFILMFGVSLQFILVVISIISVLLMILRNSHEFILWSIEPRLNGSFSNFKSMLSDSLTPKLDMFSPIGVGNVKHRRSSILGMSHALLIILL
jgi:hypothetical protein